MKIEQALIRKKLHALYDGVIAIREDDAKLKAMGAFGSDMSIELWDWAQGVGLYGIWRLYKSTGEARYLHYLEGWYERHIDEAAVKNVNHVAPMLTLVSMWEASGNKQWQPLIEEYTSWLAKDLLRTEMAGFAHTTATRNNEEQLWVDTLFMGGLFHAKAGVLMNRPDYCEEILYQFSLHAQFLIEPASGLWRHGWHFGERHHFAGALWGRGNGWAAATGVELLDMLPQPSAARRFLEQSFIRHCHALSEVQATNGMWHTLLDDADSYQESSATAAIAYAFLKASRLGILDTSFREAGALAIGALVERVDDAGEVAEVSSGTPVFTSLQEYREVPIRQRSYGQSLAMLALAEALLHPSLFA
jgi:unsaturated rhamnogalacturonyl hydrolase